MSKYMVEHRCGHTQEHQLYGKTSGRDSKAEWLAGQDCTECWTAAQDAKRQAERAAQTQAAVAANTAAGLPALQGTDKQIAWAETIRKPIIEVADQLAAHPITKNMSDAAKAELIDAIALIGSELRNQTSAKWWIDHRDLPASYASDQLRDRASILCPTLHAQMQSEAAAKAAKVEADKAAAKAQRDAETKASQEEHATNVVRAQTFRVSQRPGTVKFIGRREDFTVESRDGRIARGCKMDGPWFVYQIGEDALDSMHPEMERIASDARAQWDAQQQLQTAEVSNG